MSYKDYEMKIANLEEEIERLEKKLERLFDLHIDIVNRLLKLNKEPNEN